MFSFVVYGNNNVCCKKLMYLKQRKIPNCSTGDVEPQHKHVFINVGVLHSSSWYPALNLAVFLPRDDNKL